MDPQQLIWIQDPRSKITEKTSWIQGLDPRSKIQDSRKNILDPQQNLFSDLGKLCLRIQEVFSGILDLGSKKFFLESWILDPDLGSKKFFLESWILDPDLGSKKFFCNLGSWILDPNQLLWIHSVYKRL